MHFYKKQNEKKIENNFFMFKIMKYENYKKEEEETRTLKTQHKCKAKNPDI